MKTFVIASAMLATATLGLSGAATAAPQLGSAPVNLTLEATKIHYSEKKHWHKRPTILSKRGVARKLRHHGYRNFERISLRNNRYYVRAWGHRGPVKLIVHAHSGKILYRERLNRRHGFSYGGSHGGFSWSYTIR